jgi:hypothetical protein
MSPKKFIESLVRGFRGRKTSETDLGMNSKNTGDKHSEPNESDRMRKRVRVR